MDSAFDFSANLDQDTWVHRMDPRAKVILLCIFSIAPLFFTDPFYLIGMAVLVLPFWIGGRVKLRPIRGLIFSILIMMAILFVYNGFMFQPEEAYGIAKITYLKLATYEVSNMSILSGSVLAFRLFIPGMVIILLIVTTDPAMLAKGMMKMHMPINVAFMLLGALRLMPLLTDEMHNVTNAQTIRGIGQKGAKSAWRRFSLAAMPLMISSLRRSRTTGLALESKGFGRRAWKYYYQNIHMNGFDVFIVVFACVVLVASLVIRYVLGLGTSPLFYT